jgi:hypothetical protein
MSGPLNKLELVGRGIRTHGKIRNLHSVLSGSMQLDNF